MNAIARYSLRTEITRKAIHITIALVPALARWNYSLTVILLSAGILFYTLNEHARIRGRSFGFVSSLTALASRPAEKGFVWGPVTLGLGALAVLVSCPELPCTVAVYAVAFGDAAASLAGKASGEKPVYGEKTFAGSFACFLAVFLSAWLVTGQTGPALAAAGTAAFLELISPRDLDNLLMPVGTALVLMI